MLSDMVWPVSLQRRINGALTTAEQTIREEILVGLLTGQRWAVTGFLMQSGIGFKDTNEAKRTLYWGYSVPE